MRAIKLCLCLLVISCSNSCSYISSVYNSVLDRNNQLTSLELVSQLAANSNAPFAADVVFVYDSRIATELMPKDAATWFKEKTSYQVKFGGAVQIIAYEMVPVSYIKQVPLPSDSRSAQSIVLYVSYAASNAYFLVDLSKLDTAVVKFGAKAIQVIDESKSKEG